MPRIAYVMSRFPLLSETFILREMMELDALGWDVEPYPLIMEEVGVRHREAVAWIDRVQWVPFMSMRTMTANASSLLRAPAAYGSTLLGAILGNLKSPKFLQRALALFPKAVHVAADMVRRDVEHVHAHYATHPALLAWIVHRLTGIPFSVTVHAHDLYVDQSMLRQKLFDASFVVTVSEYNRERIRTDVGSDIAMKTHVVRCGVDPTLYPAQRGERAAGPQVPHVVSIGSLQPYKGQVHLIEAARRICNAGRQIHVTIVGEGMLRSQLERRIDESGLSAHVTLLGARTQAEVARILAGADVYVQPSVVEKSGKMEGIPVALMEAMASRLPVVATRLSGVPELVKDGETGLLVVPEDPDGLARAIELMISNRAFAERLASKGRQHVEREYDVRKNSRELAHLFGGRAGGAAVSGVTAAPQTRTVSSAPEQGSRSSISGRFP